MRPQLPTCLIRETCAWAAGDETKLKSSRKQLCGFNHVRIHVK